MLFKVELSFRKAPSYSTNVEAKTSVEAISIVKQMAKANGWDKPASKARAWASDKFYIND